MISIDLPAKKKTIILIFAFFVYTISAVFNNGFYYFDEHYQLIEFAELKTGNNKRSDLAWEFAEKVRPALQPAIAYAYLSCMRAIQITDNYLLMILLRILTAVLSVVIIGYFIKKTDHLVKPDLKIWYRLLSYFLWFLPFINVRFSSESYSGIVFLLGIALLYSNLQKKYFIVGCLLGLSFLFRFQTAFMSFGFVLWMTFIHKIKFKNLLLVVIGGGVMLVIGLLIDFWFYETPTVTFLNYYISNIVYDIASNYGIEPWYYYFVEATQYAITPIGILIWFCLLLQICVNYKNPLCWISIPFLVVHILTPHKEVRFLFPIVNFIPLLLILSIQWVCQLFSRVRQFNFTIILALAVILINLAALITNMFSPADSEGKINITQSIHDNYKNQYVALWILGADNPYKPIPIMQNFYLDKNVHARAFDFGSKIKFKNRITNLLVVKDNTNALPLLDIISSSYKITKIKSGVPVWILNLKAFLGYRNHSLSLYKLEPLN